MIERPKNGWACVVAATGRRSAWVSIEKVHVGEHFVRIEGGLQGLAGAEFSWAGLSHIEYATDEEMGEIKAMEEKRLKAVGLKPGESLR